MGCFRSPWIREELPDYHDIIKQPMDFGTVRKKLDKGLYPDLEQFEVGVAIFWNIFLECDLLLTSDNSGCGNSGCLDNDEEDEDGYIEYLVPNNQLVQIRDTEAIPDFPNLAWKLISPNGDD
ncbi:hypothetical protein Fmac_016350 [Flemingia macrophylla]|uniref:Bromo domain-containing protein n=1 Tax=Flemingia macrophylla TaxID=520843 RepID=A0ABD1MH89_9FABA